MKRAVTTLILLVLVFSLVSCEKEFKPVTVEEPVAAYEAEGYTVVDISDTIGAIPDEEPYSLISEMYAYELDEHIAILKVDLSALRAHADVFSQSTYRYYIL